jgi:hypothetical protein
MQMLFRKGGFERIYMIRYLRANTLLGSVHCIVRVALVSLTKHSKVGVQA